MNSLNSTQLIARCQSGDTVAVEVFVRHYQPLIYRLAVSILDDPAEAQEATQDTLVAALKGLGSYRGESAFKTWLYSITLNTCRRRLQKRQARARLQKALTLFSRVQGRSASPEETAARREMDRAVWQAVAGLGEPYRLAIVLRYYDNLPIAEIAQVLNTSERTVYVRLQKAHDSLKAALKGKVALTWQD